MKRYILITADFPPIIGGISTYLYNIWKYFSCEEALILAPYVKGCREFDKQKNLHILRRLFPLQDSLIERILKTILFVLYLYPIIRREKIDLLCCGHPISVGFAGFLYKIFFKIPYCIFVYGGEPVKYQRNKIMAKLMTLTLINADGIIGVSEYTKNEYRIYNPRRGFVERLNAGIDVNKFNPNVNSTNLRERFGLKDKKVILTVSRLVERKNHSLVINILPRLLQKIPNLVYIIVGKGPTEDRLRKEVRRLNLESYVIFAGGIPDEELPLYFDLCDVHIMLSRQMQEEGDVEGFGISFIEASSCAKPVIGSKTGGIGDAIEDGISGLLVDPNNKDEVLEAVLRLLTDEAYAKRLGKAGRRMVLEKFDSHLIAERFRKLLEQI